MDEALYRPGRPKFSGEEAVLRTNGDLRQFGVPPGHTMREHQDPVSVETIADRVQCGPRPLIWATCHTTAVPYSVRSKVVKVHPISDEQSEKEGTGKEACEEHGGSYHTEKRDESRWAGWVYADGERPVSYQNFFSGMRKAC